MFPSESSYRFADAIASCTGVWQASGSCRYCRQRGIVIGLSVRDIAFIGLRL